MQQTLGSANMYVSNDSALPEPGKLGRNIRATQSTLDSSASDFSYTVSSERAFSPIFWISRTFQAAILLHLKHLSNL